MESIYLRPFQPGDQKACKALVLAGLEEHWGLLDLSLNPDLNDIASSFADGYFLTAWLEGKLVGTGAFHRIGEGRVQVERMSVRRDLRGQGLGRRILKALIEEARARGYRQIILETTESWSEVVRFYLGAGFRVTHRLEGDIYFALDIGSAPEQQAGATP